MCSLSAQPARLFSSYKASRDETVACQQLSFGAHADIIPADDIPSLIHAALRCADVKALRKLLGAGKSIPWEDPNDQGAALAQLGISCGLIREGNSADCYGATLGGALAVVTELCSAGLDIDAPIAENHCTLLIDAAGRNIGLVRFLLAEGADPNIGDYAGRTALIEAVAMGKHEIVVELLSRGADPMPWALDVWPVVRSSRF